MRIFEINTRAHVHNFSEITELELTEIAGLKFDAIWLMGVWEISEGATKISKIISDDYEGSPYAVPSYRFNPSMGGETGFRALVERAHRAGLRVIVDFVSNHMALDSPWIAENPDFFIRSDASVRKQTTADYFLSASGEVIAFGRDPYFPPWHDTAQLDYTNKALRRQMIDVLKGISQIADGVRCDMAMLVLRDYIRQQWFPHAPDHWFNARMPDEFWNEAINEVKAGNPDFIFIAEAYWEKEKLLLDLGFDLTYDKRLYDELVAGAHNQIKERLLRGDLLVRALCFIENHDEPRAASVFSPAGNLAAAALILSLPASSLIYEGQMEGKRERLPVQRLRPLQPDPPDPYLFAGYLQLLQTTAAEVFQSGSFAPFETDVYGVVSFMRSYSGRTVVYVGQISNAWHKFNFAGLNISAPARTAGAAGYVRAVNLLNGRSALFPEVDGVFRVYLHQLGVSDETLFCLLELSSDPAGLLG